MLSVEQDSPVLQDLKSYSPEQLLKLLFLCTDRAATTLKCHLSGWRCWAEFRRCCKILMGAPACTSLMDFLDALAEIVGAWLVAGRWDRQLPKEALPVYLGAVCVSQKKRL